MNMMEDSSSDNDDFSGWSGSNSDSGRTSDMMEDSDSSSDGEDIMFKCNRSNGDSDDSEHLINVAAPAVQDATVSSVQELLECGEDVNDSHVHDFPLTLW